MTETHKQILEKANAAIKQGDLEGFLVHCTDDTQWTFEGDQTLRGKEAVREWMQRTYLEPPRFIVQCLIGEGNHVAAVGEITLADADGTETVHAYCDVWRFRDGRMAELHAFVVKK